jgi:prolyl oligopeptidase
MKRLGVLLVLAACGGGEPEPVGPVASATASVVPEAGPPIAAKLFDYPDTRAEDVVETLQGKTIHDRFRWLENGDDPKVKAWASAEDAFARERLGKLPEKEAIKKRLEEVLYVDQQSPPSKEGKRYFWSHRDARQEKGVLWWKEGKTGAQKVLIDPNTWSTDGSVALGAWEPSHDGLHLAYLKREHNSDEATLYVMDVASGKVSTTDVIDGAKYAGVSWNPRGDGFYYTYLPPVSQSVTVADRPGFAEVRFHKLGEDPKKDRVVHEAMHDPKSFLGGEVSRDGHFLFVYVQHGWTSTDVFFKDIRNGEPKDWKTLASGWPHKYNFWTYHDRFYVETDDGAPNHHILGVDPTKPDRAAWTEIVPERKDASIDGVSLVGGKLSIAYLKDVASHLEVHDLDGKLVREVALPTLGSVSSLYGTPDDDEAYYTFTSFTYPTEIYETNVKTGTSKLFFKLDVPVDPSKFAVEQLFAVSKDGTRVPMFVVGPKTFDKTKGAPALVYGYGGFLASQKPRFTASAYPWLERGGVYVIANLRGGAEYGEPWHQAGMGHNKQNVFDDLKAVLETLVKQGITSPDRIAIRGASNGGLLVAAALTQFPDLFRVGLCGVPLVDMLRYHKFGSGKTWIEEYGSADVAADFDSIYAYSPYQHVKPGTRYPATLILSADSDDRVDPMHARKLTAELQADSRGGIVLLRVEKNAGHGGADMVKSLVDSISDELAFALAEITK